MVARSPVVPYQPIGHQVPRDYAPRLGCRLMSPAKMFSPTKMGPALSQVPWSQCRWNRGAHLAPDAGSIVTRKRAPRQESMPEAELTSGAVGRKVEPDSVGKRGAPSPVARPATGGARHAARLARPVRSTLLVAGRPAFGRHDRSGGSRNHHVHHRLFSVTRDLIGPAQITRDGRMIYFARRVTEADTHVVTLP